MTEQQGGGVSYAKLNSRDNALEQASGVLICASCDATEEFVTDANSEEPTLCRQCRNPLLVVDIPNDQGELGADD